MIMMEFKSINVENLNKIENVIIMKQLSNFMNQRIFLQFYSLSEKSHVNIKIFLYRYFYRDAALKDLLFV